MLVRGISQFTPGRISFVQNNIHATVRWINSFDGVTVTSAGSNPDGKNEIVLKISFEKQWSYSEPFRVRLA